MNLLMVLSQQDNYLSLRLSEGNSLEYLLNMETVLFLVKLIMLLGRPVMLFSILL